MEFIEVAGYKINLDLVLWVEKQEGHVNVVLSGAPQALVIGGKEGEGLWATIQAIPILTE